MILIHNNVLFIFVYLTTESLSQQRFHRTSRTHLFLSLNICIYILFSIATFNLLYLIYQSKSRYLVSGQILIVGTYTYFLSWLYPFSSTKLFLLTNLYAYMTLGDHNPFEVIGDIFRKYCYYLLIRSRIIPQQEREFNRVGRAHSDQSYKELEVFTIARASAPPRRSVRSCCQIRPWTA